MFLGGFHPSIYRGYLRLGRDHGVGSPRSLLDQGFRKGKVDNP